MTLLTTLLTAMAQRPAGPDPIESLARLHEVTRPAAQVESGIGQMRDVLQLARELQPPVVGAEGGPGELAAIAQMVTAGAPLLLPLLNRLFYKPPAASVVAVSQNPPQAQLPASPGQSDITASPLPPSAPADVPKDADMWKLHLLQYIRSLVPLAMAKKTPGAYVPAFFDQVQDLGVPLETVKTAILSPDLLDMLAGHVPEIKTYRPWFEEFISIIREDWDEAVSELTRPPDTGDNAPDAAGSTH